MVWVSARNSVQFFNVQNVSPRLLYVLRIFGNSLVTVPKVLVLHVVRAELKEGRTNLTSRQIRNRSARVRFSTSLYPPLSLKDLGQSVASQSLAWTPQIPAEPMLKPSKREHRNEYCHLM